MDAYQAFKLAQPDNPWIQPSFGGAPMHGDNLAGVPLARQTSGSDNQYAATSRIHETQETKTKRRNWFRRQPCPPRPVRTHRPGSPSLPVAVQAVPELGPLLPSASQLPGSVLEGDRFSKYHASFPGRSLAPVRPGSLRGESSTAVRNSGPPSRQRPPPRLR